MRHHLLLSLFILAGFAAEAQSFYSIRRDRTLILTVGTGTSTYLGELANKGDYLDARPNFNVGLQTFLTPRLSARVEAGWFQLAGDDAKATGGGREVRNLSFRSNNYEVTATGAVHLFPMGNRYYQRPAINVYGFGGVGLMHFNPTAELNGVRYPLQPLMTENVKYNRTILVIPYGIGVKFKMGPFFNVAIEAGNRKTFSDYLDDVSTVHQDKSTWTDPVRIALSDRAAEAGYEPYNPGNIRGNPDSDDAYLLLNIKIEYYLPFNFITGNSQNKLYRNKRKTYYRRSKAR